MNRYWLPATVLVLGCALDCRVANAQDPLACVALNQSTPTVRAQGVAEQVSDLLVLCTGGTPVSTGAAIPAYDMQLTFNAPVTSRIIGSDGQSSEALLLVDEPLSTAQFPCEQTSGVCQSVGNGTGTGYYGGDASTNRNVFQGLLSAGTTLLWKSVPFDPPGTGQYRVFRFTNLRLDATSLTGGATGLGTTDISVTGTGGTISVDGGVLTLGTVSPSLTAVVRDGGNNTTVATGAAVSVAAAASVARVATLRFVSGFPGADKARTAANYIDADTSPPPIDQNLPGVTYGTETGFYNSTFGSYGARGDLATAGLADSGIDVWAGGSTYSNAALLRIAPAPAPMLSSITPATVPLATVPVSMTLSGSGFQSDCVVVFTPPSAAPVSVVPDSCAPNQAVVHLPLTVLGVPGSGEIQVSNPGGLMSPGIAVVLALPPLVGVSLGAPPAILSGQDQPLTLTLNSAYPAALQGTLTLTFTPNPGLPDDPAIQFQNGSRVMTFSIPAGTQPKMQVAMKSGTVAGLITITPAFTAIGESVRTLPDVLSQQIQIAPAEPVISMFTCTRTSTGIVAVVDGFTNTRAVTQASFELQTASGSQGTADLGVDVPQLFGGWFGSAQAAASGGVFRYTQPIASQVAASTVVSATVKLSNAIGTSATASCQLP